MVLSKARSASVRPYIPGKVAWATLISVLVLVTGLTFSGTSRAFHVPAATVDTSDFDDIPVLSLEIHHAGA